MYARLKEKLEHLKFQLQHMLNISNKYRVWGHSKDEKYQHTKWHPVPAPTRTKTNFYKAGSKSTL
jgi:hypothetical protein